MHTEPWRWVTSMFVHQNFQHLFSNTALFTLLAWQIESKYGWWRTTGLWLLALLGAGFFAAALENGCEAVVGSSGGIFGLVGLYIADLVINFERIKRPILRGVLMVVFMLFFIVNVAMVPTGTSHLSHLGGFLSGLFPAFLFLPSLRSERWESYLPIGGGLALIVASVALPTYVYVGVYADLVCEDD